MIQLIAFNVQKWMFTKQRENEGKGSSEWMI